MKTRYHSGKDYLQVGVVLTRSELKYDIDFASSQVARFSSSDDSGRSVAAVSGLQTAGEENEDYVYRLVDSALAAVRRSASWCVDKGGRSYRGYMSYRGRGGVASDVLKDGVDDWVLDFTLPVDWRGEVEVVASLVHDYVVNAVLRDWMGVCGAGSAALFGEKADGLLQDLKSELRKRGGVTVAYQLTGYERAEK